MRRKGSCGYGNDAAELILTIINKQELTEHAISTEFTSRTHRNIHHTTIKRLLNILKKNNKVIDFMDNKIRRWKLCK